MQTETPTEGRIRRTVNDLVVAEICLVQATVESAMVLSEQLGELRRQLSGEQDGSLAELLQRTADRAVQPYSSRYRQLRKLRQPEDE